MVVHLSPKAKALTLPLNWSQFLKTLIGAENYTLFQLPPNKTSVRPACRPSLSLAILCCLSSSSSSSFASTAITPSPRPSLDLCHSDISFSAVSNRSKYRRRTRSTTTTTFRERMDFYRHDIRSVD